MTIKTKAILSSIGELVGFLIFIGIGLLVVKYVPEILLVLSGIILIISIAGLMYLRYKSTYENLQERQNRNLK